MSLCGCGCQRIQWNSVRIKKWLAKSGLNARGRWTQWQPPLLESKGCIIDRISISIRTNIGIKTNIGIRTIIKGKVTGIVGEPFTSARLLERLYIGFHISKRLYVDQCKQQTISGEMKWVIKKTLTKKNSRARNR